jgi:RNA polymerase sigma-70 factor, ECF subfamily
VPGAAARPTITSVINPRLASADDATLVERAQDGDVVAFEVLLRRHAPTVRAMARRVVGDAADADDVVQETFIAAWRSLRTLSDPGAFRGWVLRTASRRCIDLLRRRRDVLGLDGVDVPAPDSTSPESHATMSAAAAELDAALADLPAPVRRAWLFREQAGLSYDEIARLEGVGVDTVRGRIARARSGLARRMGAWR